VAEKTKSAKHFENLKTAGFHGDGGGLYLRIAEGRRSWLFRYKIGKKTHWMGLGPDSDVGLKEAREAALAARNQLRAGVDPIEARKAAKAARTAETAQTFKAVAGEYIEAHRAGWRNPKHAAQWEATLKAYAYPVIGERPVAKVSTADIQAIIKPIWETKTETASRVRGRIENILDYAAAHHMRTGDNPARWAGHLEHSLPARAKVAKVEHHAAMAWRDMPAVVTKLAAGGGMGALCLRFTILTAARSGEARGARWNEIDLAAGVWTVPGDRMKAGVEHRVPLSAAALAVLEAVKPSRDADDGLVFQGGRKGKPLSDVALSKALAAVAHGVTVHGCRSTFRDWAAESTNFPREIAEAALAHTNKDKVEAAYLRGDHFEKRARMMDAWAVHCTRPTGTAGATPIRRTA
jgi:integrase